MRIHLNLPEDLVDQIDELAGKGKRSEYIAEAVAERARRDRLVKVIEEGAGALKDMDIPHWETPEKTDAWLRELRDTPSIREDPIERVLAGRKRADRLAKGPRKRKSPAR